MSERNGYEPGVPCWVDTRQPDPRAAVDFYTQLFGWEAETSGEYTFCRLRGRDVAAIAAGDSPAWSTHIWIEDADETAARVTDAGGSVVTAPVRRRPEPAAPPSSPTRPAPSSPSGSRTGTRAPSASTSRPPGP